MNLYKKQTLTLLFILCVALFSGCSDDEPSKDTGNITFTVGDKSFSLTNTEAVIRDGYLNVKALNGNEEILSINHRAGIATGESGLTSKGALFLSLIYMPRDGGSNYGPFADNPIGKFVITSIDEEKQIMTGSFEGVLVRYSNHEDELTINGTFTFPYTVEDEPAREPYFLHKVNGQDFKGRISQFGFSGGYLSFNANNGAEGIYVQVYREAVGTYMAGSIANGATYARYWNGLNSYGSVSGTVTITSNQAGSKGLITGTYSFELESYPKTGDKVSITEGTFTIQRP